ncbi:hypothetical protein ACYOEI_03925 [Singulisphaera rosea]
MAPARLDEPAQFRDDYINERINLMDSMERPGQRSTDPDDDSKSGAVDSYELEGNSGSEDTNDRRQGASASSKTGAGDTVDAGKVVVESGSTASAFRAHHSAIPDLQAEGATPREAVANLAQDLAREIDGVADHFRRELFGRVLENVRAFDAPNS